MALVLSFTDKICLTLAAVAIVGVSVVLSLPKSETMSVDVPASVVAILGGMAVLATYVIVFRNYSQGYISPAHPFWLGYSKPVIQTLVSLQAAAVVGFFLFAIPWLFIRQPQGGVLSRPAALAVTLAVFMAASAAWAPCMEQALQKRTLLWKLAATISLWVAAACSIMFVAGAAEETEPRWYVMLGALLFAATTTLADGIAYSARTIVYVQ